MKYEALTREEVRSVIEGRAKTRRVPVFIHIWVHADTFGERQKAVQDLLSQYPADVQIAHFRMPTTYRGDSPTHPDYAWLPYSNPYAGRQVAIDAAVALDDWAELDDVIAHFPKAGFPQLLDDMPTPDGRYRLTHWWFCLFERHWSLRGMTNALVDYYDYPDQTHRLFGALTDFYCGIIERCARERGCDGVWMSDDLGTQTAGFFSADIFREFYKPYYKRIFDTCHRHGLHAWMHACGCVTEFIPDWIDIGLDVLHPIQKHTMDEKKVAARFGDRLTIFAGLDVQQVIPWGTPGEVRAEVRRLLDTYWRAGEGRCMLTAGNGINQDYPLESLEAFLDEALEYGRRIAQGKNVERGPEDGTSASRFPTNAPAIRILTP